MKYIDIYNRLIAKSKFRGLDKKALEGYYEKHHILPKCMGGDNSKSNLVLLTGREHFIAHRLLNKIYPNNRKLLYAIIIMAGDPRELREIRIASRSYEFLKNKFSEGQRGELNPSSRPEVREKMSAAQNKRTDVRGGYKISEQGRINMSMSKKGTPLSEAHKEKISRATKGRKSNLKGIKIPQERKDRISEKLKGRKKPEFSKLLLDKNTQPWETATAKDNPLSLNFWFSASQYYAAWFNNQKFGGVKLSKLVGSDVGRSTWHDLVVKFREGWIPGEDEKWLKFHYSLLNIGDE